MTKQIVCMLSIESFFRCFPKFPEFLYLCLAFYKSIVLLKRVNVNDYLARESLHKKE